MNRRAREMYHVTEELKIERFLGVRGPVAALFNRNVESFACSALTKRRQVAALQGVTLFQLCCNSGAEKLTRILNEDVVTKIPAGRLP